MDDPRLEIYWIFESARGDLFFKDFTVEDILGRQELIRWNAMRFKKRRDDFLVGRYSAKRLLTSPQMPWSTTAYKSLDVLNESEGAPYLADQEFCGSLSISHREGAGAAAYCMDSTCEVGVDLETVESREWSFIEDFFTTKEQRLVKRSPTSIQPVLVALIWSAKESILKAWRKGLRLDTRIIEIQPTVSEVFATRNNEWFRIGAVQTDPDRPLCDVYGKVLGDSVLTLAHTTPNRNRKATLVQVF